MRLWRREVLVGIASLSCAPPRAPTTPRVAVWSAYDLPKDNSTTELSGIVWNDVERVAYAVQDKRPVIVTLVPDALLRVWRPTTVMRVDVPELSDLEGIALLSDGFLVVAESGPHIWELDRNGHVRTELRVPETLIGARDNKSLESIAVSPDGRFIFTTTEDAVTRDGPLPDATRGTRVHIVRIDRETGALAVAEYMTDRAHGDGDHGVADLAALSSTEVLVLERGWTRGYGNTVRIYRTSMGAPSKSLVVDLATIGTSNLALPASLEPQPTALLENFEGLGLGPSLPDGRRTLLLVSDDNTRATQRARVLVLTGWSSP